MPKVVALVPIKLNNRRLPGKNIKPFTNGFPLCEYILRTLKNVEVIDEIYVFCSDPSIKDYIPRGVSYLPRSKKLDADSTSINEVISDFLGAVVSDYYVLAHATAPFISKEAIQEGIGAVVSGEYDSSLSVEKLQSFIWMDGEPYNYDPCHIPRTQDLKPLYVETSGFYCFSRELFQNTNRRVGFKPKMIEVTKPEGIDIDNMVDFEMADAWFNYSTGGGDSGFTTINNVMAEGVAA